MLYIHIFSIIVKTISLLSIPIEQSYWAFIIILETPLTLPQYNWKCRDAINLILWSLSCLTSSGIINETLAIIIIEALSWIWLIIDSILENLEQKHIPILFLPKISIFQYAFQNVHIHVVYHPHQYDLYLDCHIAPKRVCDICRDAQHYKDGTVSSVRHNKKQAF